MTDTASPGEDRPLSERQGTALLTVGGLSVSDPRGRPKDAVAPLIRAAERERLRALAAGGGGLLERPEP